MRKKWSLGFAFAILICAACDPNPAVEKVVRTDSLGVTLIESRSSAWSDSAGWRIGEEPTLDLTTSGTGPPHEFHRVSDMTRLPDGTLLVALPTEIRRFASSGSHIRSIGRRGEGPGEFSRLSDVDVAWADSVLAFDYWLRRATVYGPDLSVGRVVTMDMTLAGRDVHLIGDGILATSESPEWAAEDAEAGPVRAEKALIYLSALGEVRDTLALVPGTESVLLATGDGWSDARPLFGKSSHIRVRDGDVVVGTGDFLGFWILDSTGELKSVVRVPSYDLTLTPQLLDAERSSRFGEDPSPAVRQQFEELPQPERRPAYSSLRVDATGAVWLEEHRGELQNFMSSAPRSWEVFDSTGAWLGSVELPGRFVVHEIRADHVLGVWRDGLDVEHPQLLPILR